MGCLYFLVALLNNPYYTKFQITLIKRTNFKFILDVGIQLYRITNGFIFIKEIFYVKLFLVTFEFEYESVLN